MGPSGRNVVWINLLAHRLSQKRVSVAKEIEFKDKFKNMGAQWLKKFASQTSDEAVMVQQLQRSGSSNSG